MTLDPSVSNIFIGIGAILGFIGIGAGAAKKLPFTRKEMKAGCADAKCRDMVVETATKVGTLETGQTKIFEKLNAMPQIPLIFV